MSEHGKTFQKQNAIVQPFFITETPFERTAIYLIGPLPTKRKKRCILIVIDFVIRWPETMTLSSIDLKSICEAFVETFSSI